MSSVVEAIISSDFSNFQQIHLFNTFESFFFKLHLQTYLFIGLAVVDLAKTKLDVRT
jgi:hypothetical protein